MAGGHRSFVLGPITYEVSAATLGGQVMEVDPALNGKIRPAAAGSLKVVGVALADAQPAGSAPTTVPNASWNQPEVAVAFAPCDIDVTYTLAANFGDNLITAAAGQVTPLAAVTTPTAADVTNTRAIIGYCSEPGGVLAGAVGRMRFTR